MTRGTRTGAGSAALCIALFAFAFDAAPRSCQWGSKAYFLTGGHTHLQQTLRLEDTFFFNPGSIGLAYAHHQSGAFHSDPWAEYAIFTAEKGQVSLEFRRVPIDADALIQVYMQSGRPHSTEAANQYRSHRSDDVQ